MWGLEWVPIKAEALGLCGPTLVVAPASDGYIDILSGPLSPTADSTQASNVQKICQWHAPPDAERIERCLECLRIRRRADGTTDPFEASLLWQPQRQLGEAAING